MVEPHTRYFAEMQVIEVDPTGYFAEERQELVPTEAPNIGRHYSQSVVVIFPIEHVPDQEFLQTEL